MTITLRIGGKTHPGRVREGNEDAFVVTDLEGGEPQRVAPSEVVTVGDRGVLLAVSDGLGGHQAGEVASALVVESLSREMVAQRPSRPSVVRIESAVERANRAVLAAARAPERQGMGATLTAAYVKGRKLYLASVGDSRAYLFRHGALTQVTRDQTYVQLMLDQRMLTEEEAQYFPGRHIVLQAMGQPSISIAVGCIGLRRGDQILLCSDGLTNEVPEELMAKVLGGEGSSETACDALVRLALGRGGRDNITVVIAEVDGDLPEASTEEGVPESLRVLKEFVPSL